MPLDVDFAPPPQLLLAKVIDTGSQKILTLPPLRKTIPEVISQFVEIAIPENLKSTIEKSEIKSSISEMPLVISNSDNHGLSQFAMSLFRISNR